MGLRRRGLWEDVGRERVKREREYNKVERETGKSLHSMVPNRRLTVEEVVIVISVQQEGISRLFVNNSWIMNG